RWSDSGSWWSTTVDRRRPPLTGGSGGGFVNGVGTDGRPRGTTQVVTRGKLMIELQVRRLARTPEPTMECFGCTRGGHRLVDLCNDSLAAAVYEDAFSKPIIGI
ncbi:hypothetical protein Tco_0207254, partial [Tanacetum coccineum]